MSLATLAGKRVTDAAVQIPAWGVWWAEVSLDDEEALEGRVELKLADLTLSGTIVSGGPYKGKSHYRIAAGAAGWRTEIAPLAYANDAKVPLSKVVKDAASAAGETVDAATIPAGDVGTSFVRERAPASAVLQQVAAEAWYVGEDGITRLGARTSGALPVGAQLGPVNTAQGSVDVASDEIATILPGVAVGGLTAVDVRHKLSAEGGLRSKVWGRETMAHSDALRALVLQVLPDYRYRGGPYEYRVVTQAGERLNLQAIRASLGVPDLRRVKVRPGVAGCRADLALGSRVLVSFVNNDPARAEVVGFEEAPDVDGEGRFVPEQLDLADAGGRVLRDGDVVAITGVQPGAGVTLAVITYDPTMVTAGPGDPGLGVSRVRA